VGVVSSALLAGITYRNEARESTAFKKGMDGLFALDLYQILMIPYGNVVARLALARLQTHMV